MFLEIKNRNLLVAVPIVIIRMIYGFFGVDLLEKCEVSSSVKKLLGGPALSTDTYIVQKSETEAMRAGIQSGGATISFIGNAISVAYVPRINNEMRFMTF